MWWYFQRGGTRGIEFIVIPMVLRFFTCTDDDDFRTVMWTQVDLDVGGMIKWKSKCSFVLSPTFNTCARLLPRLTIRWLRLKPIAAMDEESHNTYLQNCYFLSAFFILLGPGMSKHVCVLNRQNGIDGWCNGFNWDYKSSTAMIY